MRCRSINAGIFAIVMFAGGQTAWAQTLSFGTGGVGGSGPWDASTVNWFNGTSNVIWDPTRTAVFGGTAGTVTIDGAGITAFGVNFTTDGYVLNGGTLTLSAGIAPIVSTNSGQNATINAVLASSQQVIFGNPGRVTLTASNQMTGGFQVSQGTVAFSSDANLGVVPGAPVAESITLAGGKLAALATTTINSNRGIALGGVITGHGFEVAPAATLTYNGILSNVGASTFGFSKTGTGTLVLGGTNTYRGATVINEGTISISSNANLGQNPASPTINHLVIGSGTTLAATGTIALNSNRGIGLGPTSGTGSGTIDVSTGNTLTYGGIIANRNSGTGGLIKAGGGSLALSGANTYGGPTEIRSGFVILSGGANRLAPTTVVTLGSGANSGVLDLGGTSQTIAGLTTSGSGTSNQVFNNSATAGSLTVNQASGSSTFTGALGNPGQNNFSLTKSGAGTLILSGSNSYSGSTTMNGGVLSIAADASLGTAPGAATPGHLTIDNATLTTGANFIMAANRGVAIGPSAGAGTATIESTGSGATLTINGVIANNGAGVGRLIKSGTGFVRLSGVNTYSGGTTIQAGSLRITSDASLGAVPVAPDAGNIIGESGNLFALATTTIAANRGMLIGPNAGSGSFQLVASSGTTLTYGGVIANNGAGTGSLSLSAGGSYVLSGANTYSGGTTSSGAMLSVNNTTGSGLGSGAVSIVGSGGLGGTGSIAGAVTLSATSKLAPGNSTGILTLQNGLTLGSSTTLELEITGDTAGTGYDQVLLTGGNVALGGANLSLPTPSGTFDFADRLWVINNTGSGIMSGSFNGLLASGAVVGTFGGHTWGIFYNADFASGNFSGGNDLLFAPVPEPAGIVAICMATTAIIAAVRRRRFSRPACCRFFRLRD